MVIYNMKFNVSIYRIHKIILWTQPNYTLRKLT